MAMSEAKARIIAKARCPKALANAKPCVRDGYEFQVRKKPGKRSYAWRFSKKIPASPALAHELKACSVKARSCNSCIEELRDYLISCNATKSSCKKLKNALLRCLRLTDAQANRIVAQLIMDATRKVKRISPPAPPPPPPPMRVLKKTVLQPKSLPRVMPAKPLPRPVEKKRLSLLETIRSGKKLRAAEQRKLAPLKKEDTTMASVLRRAMAGRRRDIMQSEKEEDGNDIWNSAMHVRRSRSKPGLWLGCRCRRCKPRRRRRR